MAYKLSYTGPQIDNAVGKSLADAETRTLTEAQYDALTAADKAKDIIYVITDDETSTNFQPLITASGVLQGNGGGGITAKAVDAAPTTGSSNLVTSGGVKSALTSETDVAVTAATGTTINKHSVKNGIVTISGQTSALTGGGDNTLATITDSSCLNSDLYFSALSVLFTSSSDTTKLVGNSGVFMSNGRIQIRITGALSSGFKWLVQYQL